MLGPLSLNNLLRQCPYKPLSTIIIINLALTSKMLDTKFGVDQSKTVDFYKYHADPHTDTHIQFYILLMPGPCIVGATWSR